MVNTSLRLCGCFRLFLAVTMRAQGLKKIEQMQQKISGRFRWAGKALDGDRSPSKSIENDSISRDNSRIILQHPLHVSLLRHYGAS